MRLRKEGHAGTAAWGEPARGEPRWPASLAILVAIVLYLTLPNELQLPFGPPWFAQHSHWMVPILELILIIPLTVAAPRRYANEPRWQRYGAIALIAIVNAANFISLALLLGALLRVYSRLTANDLAHITTIGTTLLLAAFQIWLTNVLIYALWYWELDRGGPDERSSPEHREPDFLFPQMTTPECAPGHWTPSFMDYLYVSFTNSTAFSPTDTMPLTAMAKALMASQSLISLLTVALVAARAVNILR